MFSVNREKRRTVKREAILVAAHRILEKQGFEQLSMRRLAKQLKVTPTSIYFYFKDKESLVREVCDGLYRQIAKEQAPLLSENDPLLRLKNLCLSYIQLAETDPGTFRILFMEPAVEQLSSDSSLTRGKLGEDPYTNFIHCVEQVLEERGLAGTKSENRAFAEAIWALGHGAACLHISFSKDPWFELHPPQQTFEFGLEILLNGLLERKRPLASKKKKSSEKRSHH